jgi:hypothetical protein
MDILKHFYCILLLICYTQDYFCFVSFPMVWNNVMFQKMDLFPFSGERVGRYYNSPSLLCDGASCWMPLMTVLLLHTCCDSLLFLSATWSSNHAECNRSDMRVGKWDNVSGVWARDSPQGLTGLASTRSCSQWSLWITLKLWKCPIYSLKTALHGKTHL